MCSNESHFLTGKWHALKNHESHFESTKRGGGSVTNVNHRHANYNEQSIVISTNHGRGLRVHNANVTKGKTTELLTQLVYMGSRCGSAVKR
jgi:hypothetical protein